VPARQVIFVNAMIPRPGETPGTWWDNVGWEQARTAAAKRNGYSPDFDLDTYFLHDIPADLRELMAAAMCRSPEARSANMCLRRLAGSPCTRSPGGTTVSSRSSCSSGSPGSGSASSPMWCPAGTSPR
jgi:hypothetical protein